MRSGSVVSLYWLGIQQAACSHSNLPGVGVRGLWFTSHQSCTALQKKRVDIWVRWAFGFGILR
jgi:hypothetical protein